MYSAICSMAFYVGCLGPLAVLNDHIDQSSRLWKTVDVVFQPAYYMRDHGPNMVREIIWKYIDIWDPYEQAETIMKLPRNLTPSGP